MKQSLLLQPHQFRTRNDLFKTRRTQSNLNENAAKSTIASFIPSLITVWLQVRVLPGPPTRYLGFDFALVFLRFVSFFEFVLRTETLSCFRYSSRRAKALPTIFRFCASRM